jgi:hypothetical protein
MHEVGLTTFATAHADGAMVIDVREPHERTATVLCIAGLGALFT